MENCENRIGILTLSASDNCGSLLQTYALQRVILNLGYKNVEIINFQSELSKRAYDIFPRDIILQPRKFLFTLINYRKVKRQKRAYDEFRQERLLLSEKRYSTVSEIKELADRYDVIVCGSDQIWNVKMFDFSEAFFLPEINNIRKIAYAASLGGQSLKNYKNPENIKKWLNNFNEISVRETDGRDEIASLYRTKVEVLADPTLLLSKEIWLEIAGAKRIVEEDYIFYYSWSYNDKKLIHIVQKISLALKKPVYVINASKWLIHSYKKYGFHLCQREGPYAFTNLICYADLVLVESLHGSIFSTIYEKNFWYLNGCNNGIDQRNKYFLDLLGMSNRIIDANQQIDYQLIQDEIIYQQDERIGKLKQKSICWLAESIRK